MATQFGYKRDAVRIKALKYDGSCMPDTRKFSVDPRITSFEVLKSILAKAFDIKGDFTLSYRVLDDYGQETYLPISSDWDLDAAFVSACEPCLCLRVEMTVYEEVGQEWESGNASFSWIMESKIPLRLQGLIMNHVEKTVNIVRGALNFIEEVQQGEEVSNLPPRQPLTDSEFRQFLDPVGQLIHVQNFKNSIYLGGVEPSLRKVVWKHLLNVYPDGLSGKQRIHYMKIKSYEYEQLRDTWKNLRTMENHADLTYVTNMVKKDVLRTDRHHGYYAGSDDNQNIVSLFNILTTYALNHPSVSYCQGMSDLASPLLVTMGDEAHAYICFCGLMRRLAPNFLLDGVAMTQRFQHLADALLYYDPTFYAFLKAHQADDLLFCYRWLLLEMKREFTFEDALRMMEVMWSSLPPASAPSDLPLFEVRFCTQSNFPPPTPSPRETPYAKVCALRRQTSSGKIFRINRSLDESLIAKRRYLSKMQGNQKKFNSLDDSALSKQNNYPSSMSSSFCQYSSSYGSNSLNSSPNSVSQFSNLKQKSNELCNRLVRKGSLNLSNPTGKIVKNFNEFLSLDRKNFNKAKTKLVMTGTDKKCESSPDDSGEYYPMTTSMTRELSRELENLDKHVFSDIDNNADLSEETSRTDSKEFDEETSDEEPISNSKNEDVFIWENPLQCDLSEENNSDFNGYKDDVIKQENRIQNNSTSIRRNANNYNKSLSNAEINKFNEPELSSLISRRNRTLPPPWEFAGGNPFLMYLCVTVLCQHREILMKSAMDYNEIAMHFDKMVRKHNVTRVLNQARIMYATYLRQYKQNYLNI